MSIDEQIRALRAQLPQLEGTVYFNHGAAAVLPTSVVEASIEGVRIGADYSVRRASRKRWAELRNETRAMAAQLVNASPRNIAFVQSTSVALSIISLAIPWRPGENVITAAVDNPATVVPWQNQAHAGVEVRYLPADGDDLVDLDALADLIDDNTRLVAVSLVEYSTGQRLAVRRIVEQCAPRGILVSVDAVQAAGAVPIDVKALGVNFLSTGAQKWLLGPRNIAILYADDAAVEAIRSPIVTESCVRDIAHEEEDPTSGIPQLQINEGARKLEAVPYYNFSGVCGLHQTLANLRAAGPTAVYRRVREITDELVEGLSALDGRVVSPRGEDEWSGIVSFAPNGVDTRELVAALQRADVYISRRKGRLRICPHYYNTSDEVARFLSLLRDHGVRPA